MLLGRVVGTVWATRKDERLEGVKLLLVQATDIAGKTLDGFLVAVDSVQAGVGELVLVAQGSSARQTTTTKDRPVDAVVMAVVDRLDVIPDEQLRKEFDARRKPIEEALKRVRET